ncbi:MAG: hypothetical protein J5679_03315, partial [Alphaproteobacteria bacterium]|nr:hypothetical protein [Alphaproteobacteria bacterium]
IMFYDNFGLTVSGELMMSTTAPIKFGGWIFPSKTPPSFTDLEISRAEIPPMPEDEDFEELLMTGWKSVPPTLYYGGY